MTSTTTRLYKYLNAKTNETIYPTTIEIDRINMVIQNSLYTLKVGKVIKHGYQDKYEYEFIITTYYLESETV
jgi:hypothetical protein